MVALGDSVATQEGWHNALFAAGTDKNKQQLLDLMAIKCRTRYSTWWLAERFYMGKIDLEKQNTVLRIIGRDGSPSDIAVALAENPDRSLTNLRLKQIQGKLFEGIKQRKDKELNAANAKDQAAYIKQQRLSLWRNLLADTKTPLDLRVECVAELSKSTKLLDLIALKDELSSVPAELQKTIALALAGSKDGADLLLAAAKAEKCQPKS